MRIVRYELEIVDYQQIQPLWPGRILAIKPGRLQQLLHRKSTGERLSGAITLDRGDEIVWTTEQKIDMWCIDAELPVDEVPPTQIPILGVWIVGTGNPMPEYLVRHGSSPDRGYTRGWDGNEVQLDRVINYQDTCVMTDGLVWHVFAGVVGHVHPPDVGYGQVSSVDDIAAKVAERRREELQRIADMDRESPRRA